MGAGGDPLYRRACRGPVEGTAFDIRIAQMDMARLLDVPREVLEAYETGEVSIPAGDLYAAAKALEVGTGYFYEGLDQRFGTTANVEAKAPKKRAYSTSP